MIREIYGHCWHIKTSRKVRVAIARLRRLVCQKGDPGSIRGQAMWPLWRVVRHPDRFYFEYFHAFPQELRYLIYLSPKLYHFSDWQRRDFSLLLQCSCGFHCSRMLLIVLVVVYRRFWTAYASCIKGKAVKGPWRWSKLAVPIRR